MITHSRIPTIIRKISPLFIILMLIVLGCGSDVTRSVTALETKVASLEIAVQEQQEQITLLQKTVSAQSGTPGPSSTSGDPSERGEDVVTDTTLFSSDFVEVVKNSMARGGAILRVKGKEPIIADFYEKYGEPDTIKSGDLTFALDEQGNPIELKAVVFFYGRFGLGVLDDQEIDQEIIDYIEERYSERDYEALVRENKGEIIWVVIE